MDKKTKRFWLEIDIGLIGLGLFFIAQTFFGLSELSLTILAILVAVIIFIQGHREREIFLFFLGVVHGLLIEVVLGLFHRQQVWLDASFFGIPFWLPIVWGIGFIYVSRLTTLINKSRRV